MSQPQQPGMLQQMATTAGGVALGSVAAHGIMGAMGMGGSSRSSEEAAPAAAAAPPAHSGYESGQQAWGSEQRQNPCAAQMEEFMRCARSQSDLSLCTPFNDALKECKIQYGL